MKSNTSIRSILSFLLWSALFLAAIIFPVLIKDKIYALIGASFVWLTKLAYEHFDSFNLLINRFFLWVLNKEVAWEMKLHFEGDYHEQDMSQLVDAIKRNSPSMIVIHKSHEEYTVSIPDVGMVIKMFIAEFRTGEQEFSSELVANVQRLVVPFRHSSRVLQILSRLIEDAFRKTLNPNLERYEFKAFFVSTNPYLGLFLRRLKALGMPRINIEYGDKDGVNEGRVIVSTEKISLVTKDLHSFQALSTKYITLSSLNLSET